MTDKDKGKQGKIRERIERRKSYYGFCKNIVSLQSGKDYFNALIQELEIVLKIIDEEDIPETSQSEAKVSADHNVKLGNDATEGEIITITIKLKPDGNLDTWRAMSNKRTKWTVEELYKVIETFTGCVLVDADKEENKWAKHLSSYKQVVSQTTSDTHLADKPQQRAKSLKRRTTVIQPERKKKRKDERKTHKAGNHVTESGDSVWYEALCSPTPGNVKLLYSTEANDVTCLNCKKMMKKRSTKLPNCKLTRPTGTLGRKKKV